LDSADPQFGMQIANQYCGLRRCGSIMVNMAQDIQVSAAPSYSLQLRNARVAGGCLLIGALVAAIYAGIIVKLVTDWWQIPDFSHGFLVPIFSAYLVWTKREALREIVVSPSWNGVVVVTAGLAVLFIGVYGAEMFLSRISLVILLGGLILSFGGRQFLRELQFPLLVLLLAIPIPAILFSQITFPLQILASKLASDLLPLFDVPVLREGNVIQLSSMSLEVAEACSGIRSLMSLFTLSVFFGYFMENSVARRTVLALASIPIAIAANAVRIFGTGMCVQYWNPDKAQGFFHEFSGWVMFLVSFMCLFIVHRAMAWLPRRRRSA
jgi:exosortase